jgi:multiple sugar transport system substrate-binding protein
MYTDAEIPKAVRDLFMKQNPTIKINMLQYDASRLNAMLAAGQPPDIVRIDAAAALPNVAARGLALDLTPYFQKSSVLKDDNILPINDVYRWDGKQQGQGPRYGLVKDWSQDVMLWYNKKLFDQAKVPYPDSNKPLTYDELLDLSKRVTVRQGDKIQIYGLSPQWGWNTQGHILQLLAQQGGTLFSSDYTKVDFTTPEAVKIFQWYVDWAQAHVGPSPLEGANIDDSQLFLSDRLAMTTWGYWFGGYIRTVPGLIDRVGFAVTPQFGSTPVSACLGATGCYIPKSAKNIDAAWKFFEFFEGGQPANDRAKSGWGMPPLKSQLSLLPQDTSTAKMIYQVQEQSLPSTTVLKFSPYISNDAMESAIQQAIVPVMKKQASLSQAVAQLTDTVNLLLQQGKSQIG